MEKEKNKITIEIKEILGSASPFSQGGSWRLTIPKRVVAKYEVEKRKREEPYISFVFVDTDKGLLLLPLSKIVTPENLRNALT